jgi:DNA-binding CsgD family transcriptional regulator
MLEPTPTFTPLRVLTLVHEMFALSEQERLLLLRLVNDRSPIQSDTAAIASIDGMRFKFAREGAHLLSAREKVVLSFIMGGKSNKAIARILDISPNTVQAHRRRAKDKLGAETTADLVRLATAAGLEPSF